MKKCNWDIDDLVEIVTAVAKEELLPRFSKISVKKKMDGSLHFALPIRIGSMQASAQVHSLDNLIMEI